MLTERQQRELDYHRLHAAKNARLADERVSLDVVTKTRGRWWWNPYWHTYGLLRRHDLHGKKILVPGCGFAEDVIRLANLGANVFGFDLSPDSIEIARKRVAIAGVGDVDLRVLPSETTDYPPDFFDGVFLRDILHHVDIDATMQEICRVCKPGALIIGSELYTHSFLQRHVRENWLVRSFLYDRMVKFIYGRKDTYVTEDEHKIDERELGVVLGCLEKPRLAFFYVLAGRLFPDRFTSLVKLDRLAMAGSGWAGRFLGSRVVFEGTLRK